MKSQLKRSIALTGTIGSGGVSTVAKKVERGLRLCGFETERLLDAGFSRIVAKELGFLLDRSKFDAVICFGSTPLPDHLLPMGVKLGLFVHGFANDETQFAFKRGGLGVRARALALSAYRRMALGRFPGIDFYICHSRTAVERNGLVGKSIIVPQFILPEDQFAPTKEPLREQRPFRVVAYLSKRPSPRLLSMADLQTLANSVSGRIQRGFEMCIVTSEQVGQGGGDTRTYPIMGQTEFQTLLKTADLYLERCKDEELGYASLEAGILGVPVAKLTQQRFSKYCDYGPNDVVGAATLDGLADRLVRYANSEEGLGVRLSSNFRAFLEEKRSWHVVSKPLLARFAR